MTRPWLLAAVAASLAVVVALACLYPRVMLSPGPLLPEHAALEGDCFACHAPLRGAVAERCIGCHAVADIGLRSTTGVVRPGPARVAFHQNLRGQDCVACHGEHQGSRIGQAARMSFSHALLQPAALATCTTCHVAPASNLHRGFTAGCAQCHGTEAWAPASFDHARHFVLEGEHDVPCASCHVGNDTSRYTCTNCHEHAPDRIAARHRREGIEDVRNCASCHRSAHGEPQRRGGRERD